MMPLTPVFSAVTCGVLTAFSCRDNFSGSERRLKRILLFYLFVSGLGWYVTYCYEFYPSLFVWLNVPCLLSFILPAVFFYRIIRFLTRPGQAEDFPRLHYVLPGALAAVMFVWSLTVPLGVQLEIVTGKAQVLPAGYEAFTRFFTIKPLMRVIFGTAYYALTVAVLVRYYWRINGKETLVRRPASWIVFLIAISIASLLSSVLPTFMPRGEILRSAFTAFVAVCIACQHVLLTYHIIQRKYRLYAVSQKEIRRPLEPEVKPERKHYAGRISQQRMESYFSAEKPYLNPAYKLTDLVEAMDVSRAVLSAFINQTYGVNFSRYVNRWRLRELEQLRSQPANRKKSASALCVKAGFPDYRRYARAAAAEREAAKAKRGKRRKEADDER